MKKFFFLPRFAVWFLFTLLVVLLFNFSLGQTVFLFLPFGLIAFAFRKSVIPFTDTLRPDGEIYISPVHGKVESIRQNVSIFNDTEIGHEIRISISVWDEKGLYLPTAGEVSYLKANKGKKISRDAEIHSFYGSLEDAAHTDLILASRNKTKTLMRFVDGPYCRRPTIWIKSGDRGRGAACFGYYPFGGTLLVYLPKNSDVLVYESEQVRPGHTVIGTIRDVN